jgi:hypothetical protein
MIFRGYRFWTTPVLDSGNPRFEILSWVGVWTLWCSEAPADAGFGAVSGPFGP